MFKQLKSKLTRDKDKSHDGPADADVAVVAVRPKHSGTAPPVAGEEDYQHVGSASASASASGASVAPLVGATPTHLRVSARRSSSVEESHSATHTAPASPSTSCKETSQSGRDSPRDGPSTPKVSRLSSLFRSGSKNARAGASGTPTGAGSGDNVEAMGTAADGSGNNTGWLDGFSNALQNQHLAAAKPPAAPSGTSRASSTSVSAGPSDGAFRTGSLRATPVAPGMRRNALPTAS